MEVVFRKTVKNLARITKLDTQKLRKNAIKNLEEFAKIAHDFATNTDESKVDRMSWARLFNYIVDVHAIRQLHSREREETRSAYQYQLLQF